MKICMSLVQFKILNIFYTFKFVGNVEKTIHTFGCNTSNSVKIPRVQIK